MMKVMGDSDICILRGHGVVVCGRSVEDATIKAIKLDDLAKRNLQPAAIGNVAASQRRHLHYRQQHRHYPAIALNKSW